MLEVAGITRELLADDATRRITGPHFSANGFTWQLVVQLNKKKDGEESRYLRVSLHLLRFPPGCAAVTVTTATCLVGTVSRNILRGGFTYETVAGWGKEKFMTDTELINQLVCGVVAFKAAVTFTFDGRFSPRHQVHIGGKQHEPVQLGSQLGALLTSAEGSDVRLEFGSCGAAGEQATDPLHAHALVLRLRSPVFAALLAAPESGALGSEGVAAAGDKRKADEVPLATSGRAARAGRRRSGAGDGADAPTAADEDSTDGERGGDRQRVLTVPGDIKHDTLSALLNYIYTDGTPKLETVEEVRAELFGPQFCAVGLLCPIVPCRLLSYAVGELLLSYYFPSFVAIASGAAGAAPPERCGPLRPARPRGVVRGLHRRPPDRRDRGLLAYARGPAQVPAAPAPLHIVHRRKSRGGPGNRGLGPSQSGAPGDAGRAARRSLCRAAVERSAAAAPVRAGARCCCCCGGGGGAL